MRFEYGSDQNIGLSDREVQEDQVRVGKIKGGAGQELLVALVADGESPYGQGERAAKLAVSALRQKLKSSATREAQPLAAEALAEAHQALRREIEADGRPDLMQVAVALAIIQDDQLYFAHAGNCRAYLSRNGRLIALTGEGPTETSPLGARPEMRARFGIVEPADGPAVSRNGAIPLRPGDHLLLSTDGLFQPQPGSSEPLVDVAQEAPRLLRDRHLPPLEAARTLVSLAVGRKAQDNVSVAIVSAPAPRNRWLLPALFALLLLVALLIGGGLFAAGAFDPEPTPTATPLPTATATPTATPQPEDPGRACILDLTGGAVYITGEALAVTDCLRRDGGIVVAPASAVEMRLSDGSRLYLGPDTELLLEQIDQVGDERRTVLSLESGTLLLRPVTDGDEIAVLDNQGDQIAAVSPGGALAVSRDEAQTTVSCIGGNCQTGAGIQLAEGAHSVATPDGAPFVTTPIPQPVIDEWRGRCGECFPDVEGG